jgi:type IV pilus assembly protein PilO
MAASSGAMADFARLPTSRKILLFAVIGLVIGFLYYRFVFKSLDTSVEKAKNVYQQAAGQNTALENDLPEFEKLRAKKEEVDVLITENQKALPTESEVPAFFETLERKITESGVDILKWNKRSEEPVESFVKVPLDVELTGTFLQIKRFFASLVEKKSKPTAIDNKGVEERERIVSIENLSLSAPTVRNREIVLTAKFTAVTFRQADVVPTAGAPGVLPSATPATGGSAPAMPSTSSPPMPSAGTPEGARIRTENALEKDQQRRDGAIDKANGGSGSDRLKGGL